MTFIIPSYPSIYCISKYCVRYSYILIAIVPVLLLIFWFTRKTFVKFGNRFELEAYLKSKKNGQEDCACVKEPGFCFPDAGNCIAFCA